MNSQDDVKPTLLYSAENWIVNQKIEKSEYLLRIKYFGTQKG